MSTENPVIRSENDSGRETQKRPVGVSVNGPNTFQPGSLARRTGSEHGANHRATSPGAEPQETDAALSTLQQILFGTDRDRIQVLVEDVDSLRHRIDDKEAFALAIAPVLGDAIRRQIHESRNEVIDALYPIIGQLVVRAVTEAMRDLARSIDERIQAATNFQRISWRLRSQITGVPIGELALRSGMYFSVEEIYLIHRESGLLLWHATANQNERSADSDLVGAMLTAIREFAEQVLGGGGEDLHHIRFGNRELIMEFARHSYVGVLLNGVVPEKFRWQLHQRIFAFEDRVRPYLQNYSGEALPLSEAASREFRSFLSIGAEFTQ